MARRPFGDRVIVRERKADEVSAGGILIPEKARVTEAEGTVVMSNVAELPVGSYVLFKRYAGCPVDLKDPENTYMLLEPEDIIIVDTEPTNG